MKAKEAIGILRNAAFLGTEKDCQKIEDAINVIEKYLEKFRWHPYPEEKPEKEAYYLCKFNGQYGAYHDVCKWVNDLYKLDKYDFPDRQGVSGFAILDREYGWEEYEPDAWMPITWNGERR